MRALPSPVTTGPCSPKRRRGPRWGATEGTWRRAILPAAPCPSTSVGFCCPGSSCEASSARPDTCPRHLLCFSVLSGISSVQPAGPQQNRSVRLTEAAEQQLPSSTILGCPWATAGPGAGPQEVLSSNQSRGPSQRPQPCEATQALLPADLGKEPGSTPL